MMYETGFYISEETSNNAFSYKKRHNRGIYVAPLIEDFFEGVMTGNETVFEDFDEDGELMSCKGLQNFVKLKGTGNKSVYVFDNHNHAFYFWHLEKSLGRVKDGALLIHIDQHKDSRQPVRYLAPPESHDMKKVFRYTNTILNVGNFIPAAQKTGLISKVVNVNSEESIKSFDYSLLKDPNKIIDLDMDFFAPELDYIDVETKFAFAARCVSEAKIVTAATSPFFIDQDRAIRYLAKTLKMAHAL